MKGTLIRNETFGTADWNQCAMFRDVFSFIVGRSQLLPDAALPLGHQGYLICFLKEHSCHHCTGRLTAMSESII